MAKQPELHLGSFQVRDVVTGSHTGLQAGVLSVNIAELKERLLEDSWFSDVDVEIVRPGSSVRIVHVVDVVEPRIRVSDPGTDFPGMLSLPRTVGMGRTHRLAGVAVTEVAEPVPGEPTYWREAIIDMSGVGARFSPFAALINLVLSFKPNPKRFITDQYVNVFEGSPEAVEYGKAVRVAGLKAAVYLAEVTRSLEPDAVETYALGGSGLEALPRVAYAYQAAMPYVYGEIAPGGGGVGGAGALPTLIHPNEILDGALVNAFAWAGSARESTYMLQNHALLQELYRNHGKSLDFRGVVFYTFGDNLKTKERITSHAATLVQLLGAQGAILNYLGGGHPIVDVMMTCEKLEKRGVKTTLLLMEMAQNPEDSGHVHYVREAGAIISTGNYEQVINLPPVERVIGGSQILVSEEAAEGALALSLRHVLAATDQFGSMSLRGRGY